jgi:predicted MFS family arabinose efflux permease
LLHNSFFFLGRGSGSFVGGHVIAKFGIRQGFRVMGLVAVISGIIYALLHILWLRKVDKSDEGGVKHFQFPFLE